MAVVINEVQVDSEPAAPATPPTQEQTRDEHKEPLTIVLERTLEAIEARARRLRAH